MCLTSGKTKVQPSLLLWEQLLKAGSGVMRVKNVTARRAEKESLALQSVVRSLKAA